VADWRDIPWLKERAGSVREQALAAFTSGDARAFTAFMAWMYADLDRAVTGLLENYPPPFALACHKGCWYCCHTQVSLSAPEAVYLAAILAGLWSEDSRGWVAEQSRRRRDVGSCHAAVWKSGLACPLLESGVCQAYEARPLACRGGNSLDWELCRQAYLRGEPETQIRRYAPQVRAAELYRGALMHAAKDAGLEYDCLSMTDGLLAYLPLDRPGEAWLAGGLAVGP